MFELLTVVEWAEPSDIQEKFFLENSEAATAEERIAEYLTARCQLNALRAAGIVLTFSVTMLHSE